MKKFFILPMALMVLGACGNDEADTEAPEEPTEETAEESPMEMPDVPEAPSIDKGDNVETTIPVENSDNWVEDASEETNAVSGDDYVQLDHGVLTVNQINGLLKHLPMEVTFAD